MLQTTKSGKGQIVALFTRAWIEMTSWKAINAKCEVALFTRAWIEIRSFATFVLFADCRPLYEGVD